MKTNIISRKIKIHATIEIDEEEAYILQHLTDFGYLTKFWETCSHDYSAARMGEILKEIRVAANKIVGAHQKIVQELKGVNSAKPD